MKLKIVSLAIFIAILTAGSQTRAAVSSLPIGSVEKVLNHEMANTYQFIINIQAANSNADLDSGNNVSFLYMDRFWEYQVAGGTVSIIDLCRRSAHTTDKAELKALLADMFRVAVATVNTNDPALQGKVISVSANGVWQPVLLDSSRSALTIGIDNRFVLGSQKDAQGNSMVPDSAYQISIAPVPGRIYQTLFIDNVYCGVVKDSQGVVIDVVLVPNYSGAIGIGNEVFTSQAGTVELWYTDGGMQVFSAVDGSLVSPLPAVKFALASPGTAKLSVGNLLPGPVTIKYSTNLVDWFVLTVLTSSDGAVELTEPVAGQAKFYRACPGTQ